MTLVLGIRSFLTPDGAQILARQAADAREWFPNAKLVLLACGEQAPAELAGQFDRIIHYSPHAVGYTKPWELVSEYADTQAADELIVLDGNDQHIMANVKAAYTKAPMGLTIPQRMQRVVFARDPIDGLTLEDLENAFLRHKHRIGISDLQGGLFIIKGRELVRGLDMHGLPDWVGDLAFYDRFLTKFPNAPIHTPNIAVRGQHFTLSSRRFIFRGIQACEKYFAISLTELVRRVLVEPSFYLQQGSAGKIEDILTAYRHHINSEKIKDMKGLVLAAGRGSRLGTITAKSKRPKPLIPIANKPMIFYVIEQLVNAGITDIGIVIGSQGDAIREAVGDGFRWKVKITYIVQEDPKGLAHAVQCAKQFLGEAPFILYLSDNFLRDDLSGFVLSFAASDDAARLMLTRVHDPSAFGVAELDEKDRVVRLEEKPKKPKSDLAVIGVYAFRRQIFSAITKIKASARGELEITDAVQKLIEENEAVSAEIVNGWWHDAGNVQSLLRANWLMLDKIKNVYNEAQTAQGAEIVGRVQIGKGSRISAKAQVRGPAIIGLDCEIGAGAFIGPFTSIGNGCKISDTHIESSIVFEQAVIKKGGFIADSIIGQKARVEGDGASKGQRRQIVVGDEE